MYMLTDLSKIEEIKNNIIYEYEWGFWAYPKFGSIKEDDTLVELFAQERKDTSSYKGKMIDVKIFLGEFRYSSHGFMKHKIQLLKNYVKNVDGVIKEIETEELISDLKITAYIAIPEDAPYCSELEQKLDDFTLQEHRLAARHYLRHIEHKNLPEYRKENQYIENYEDKISREIFISIVVAIIVLLASHISPISLVTAFLAMVTAIVMAIIIAI